jgi:hypothetical protein
VDANGDDGGVAYYAVERIIVTPKEAGADLVIGYDLDDHCTGLATKQIDPPCTKPGEGIANVDGPGGVDNSFLAILDSFSFAVPMTSPDPGAELFNKQIRVGARTLIVALKDYNGGPNDTKVKVGLIASEGLDLDGGSPQWKGADTWTHTSATQFFQGGPTLELDGYVRDNVLVARPLAGALLVNFGAFSLKVHGASIVGTLVSTVPGTLVNGVITGRVVANELIEAALQIPVASGPCSADTQSVVCGHRDIASDPASDGRPGAICDSVSIGIGFAAVRAMVSGTVADPVLQLCDAGKTCSP